MREENDATLRSILRSDAVILGLCLIAIGLQFLFEAPFLTRELFVALTAVAENEVWGACLIAAGAIRVVAVVGHCYVNPGPATPSNYRFTLASSVAAGLSGIAWATMALIYASRSNGGNLLFVLAIIDTTRSIRLGKIAATIGGRMRRRGTTARTP